VTPITGRGPLHEALAPIVRANPRITPERALERLEQSEHANVLEQYPQPLSAVRRTLRDLKT
jgi:hypothetical protein